MKTLIPSFYSGVTEIENNQATIPLDKYTKLLSLATGITVGNGHSRETALANKLHVVGSELLHSGKSFNDAVGEVLLTIECIEMIDLMKQS